METLSWSDIFRAIFGLIIMIMNLISLVILFQCKKMAFQVRTFTIQLAITDVVSGFLTSMVGLHISTYSFVTCRMSYHSHMVIGIMTTFTITAMAGDRFLALCFPFRYHQIVTSKRVMYLSITLWGLSLACSLLSLIWMDTSIYNGCNYIETVIGRYGFRMYASLWGLVIILNVCFYAGILWAMVCKNRGNGSSVNGGGNEQARLQRIILTKMLAITGLFVVTYFPSLIMMFFMALDYDNRKKYVTMYFVFVLLSFTNSILNPVVYVWRYPECRYKLLFYCNFWSQERQDRLKERMNRYNATYNMAAGARETPASTGRNGTTGICQDSNATNIGSIRLESTSSTTTGAIPDVDCETASPTFGIAAGIEEKSPWKPLSYFKRIEAVSFFDEGFEENNDSLASFNTASANEIW